MCIQLCMQSFVHTRLISVLHLHCNYYTSYVIMHAFVEYMYDVYTPPHIHSLIYTTYSLIHSLICIYTPTYATD